MNVDVDNPKFESRVTQFFDEIGSLSVAIILNAKTSPADEQI